MTALAGSERVVVVGTGLTMIDVALTLSVHGGTEIVAVSTHGELPRVHAVEAEKPGEPAAQPGEFATADALAARIEAGTGRRRLAARDRLAAAGHAGGAVAAVAADREGGVLRTPPAALGGAPQPHRPADRRAAARAAGRRAPAGGGRHGRVGLAGGRPDQLRLGEDAVVADGVVNAIGPAWDCRRGDDALLQHLLDTGAAIPSRVGLGLATTADGRLIDRDGRASEHIVTLGSLRRGELWETIAVPELRTQAAELAERLAGYATRT